MLKKKISISSVWNQFIYDKYAKNIKIDIEQIKRDILSDNKQNEYFLSEIVFNLEFVILANIALSLSFFLIFF